MRRAAVALILAVAVVSAVPAAPKPGDPFRIAVGPAAAPKPSMTYRLIPDRRDLTPGNASTLYYRAMASFVENSGLLKEIRQEYWQDWLDTPVNNLPMQEVGDKVQMARNLLHEIDLAAHCKDCDWQIEDRPEGIGLLLPEVQVFRAVAVVLAVKARYEIAQGKWDEACRTLQTGYAAARHFGEGPTLIHVLIGGAVARIMNDQVDALIQQPGAPNLYWALTDLARPFLDPELAVEQESRMLDRMMPWVKKLDGPPLSEAGAQAVMDEMRKSIDRFESESSLVQPGELETVGQAFFLVQGVGEAKRGLAARGKYTAEQVEAMPQFQVVSLYAYLEYRDSLDDMLKWVHAPNGLRHPGFQKASERYGQALARVDRLFFRGQLSGVFGVGNSVGASVQRVYGVVGRTDRRIAALECVEALRMYAAVNGKWPDKLDAVTDVPPPDDPVTGKPFEYRVQENKAVIATPTVTAGKSDGPDGATYEVYLRQ
ncbi:MAG TPA: hypothetical protein VMS17_22980 [Gemmataceae bacterium]|nr:hypothetical protein [Gemmataceae bacterium]